jgi:hypothetical protein
MAHKGTRLVPGVIPLALVIVGLCLLSFASWAYFASGNVPGIEIEGPDREVVVAWPGQQTSVVQFQLQNRSSRLIQVIGAVDC